jgi:hypothetical protein
MNIEWFKFLCSHDVAWYHVQNVSLQQEHNFEHVKWPLTLPIQLKEVVILVASVVYLYHLRSTRWVTV